jgi:hypothetical protein
MAEVTDSDKHSSLLRWYFVKYERKNYFIIQALGADVTTIALCGAK